MTAFFQSVTARTAGFNTIDIGAMSDAGVFFLIVLMFIGASPGGTGGGIKTTTFGVMCATLITVVSGRENVNLLGRRLDNSILLRAFVIAMISVATIIGATLIMVIIEGRHLLSLLFEVTSAFSTVGLSTGITTDLNLIERLLITVLMFIGRVGPLTLAMAMMQRSRSSHVKYPDGIVMVG